NRGLSRDGQLEYDPGKLRECRAGSKTEPILAAPGEQLPRTVRLRRGLRFHSAALPGPTLPAGPSRREQNRRPLSLPAVGDQRRSGSALDRGEQPWALPRYAGL